MEFPKTLEGLVELISEVLSKSETTYVSFCQEMDNNNRLFVLCNNCKIHKEHNSRQLLCLPHSCWELIRKNQTSQKFDNVLLFPFRSMFASRRQDEKLVDLLVPQLGRAETSYVSFCKEMESAKNDRSPETEKLFRSFCAKNCEIHRWHASQQLLCLPYSSLEYIRENQRKKIPT